MTSGNWCEFCKAFMYGQTPHKCPPLWDVWCPDNGDDRETGSAFYAIDAQAAAEEWAANYDSFGDYTIVSGNEEVVLVVPHDALEDTKPRKFGVIGESVPEYTAREEF